MRLSEERVVRRTDPEWLGQVIDLMLARLDEVHARFLPQLARLSETYEHLVAVPGFRAGSRAQLIWMHRGLLTIANGGVLDTGPLEALAAERREQGIALDEVRAAHRLVADVLWQSYTEVVTELALDPGEALGRGAELHRSLSDETVGGLTTGYLTGAATSQPSARLIAGLTSPGGPSAGLDVLCGELGLDPEGVFLAAAVSGGPSRLELPGELHGVASAVGGAQIVLTQHQDGDLDGAEARLLDLLRAEAPHAVIGIGLSHRGLDGAATTIDEARRSRQAAERLGDAGLRYRSRWTATMALDAEDGVRGVLDPLIRLLDEDRELMETARAYLEADGSLTRAAEELYLHANTVRYRLGRIGELSGIDVRGMRGGWSLYVALTLAFGKNGSPGPAGGRTPDVSGTSLRG